MWPVSHLKRVLVKMKVYVSPQTHNEQAYWHVGGKIVLIMVKAYRVTALVTFLLNLP